MQTKLNSMKDSYKVIVAVLLSVATVFGVQYGLLDYFEHPDNASAQSGGGTRVQATDNIVFDIGDTFSTSTTRTDDVPYALPLDHFYSKAENNRVPMMTDVNGDGLADMIYSYVGVNYADYKDATQYVLLNVGDGYEVVYYCKVKNQKNGSNQDIPGAFEYTGHCGA